MDNNKKLVMWEVRRHLPDAGRHRSEEIDGFLLSAPQQRRVHVAFLQRNGPMSIVIDCRSNTTGRGTYGDGFGRNCRGRDRASGIHEWRCGDKRFAST